MPVALLPTHTQLHIPVTVVNGLKRGPRLWISAAVHGDELNGVEIISRVLAQLKDPLRRGTIVAVPIVNVFGFIGQSRYLPDRRDLNRSFPGSLRGSLAARVAHLFMTEIVERCTHGIDLHTAAVDRSNLPQVRGELEDPETRRLAEAFNAPVMMQSPTRPGSLRSAASKRGISSVVFEGGEAQRFNESVIGMGTRGIFGVLHELGMVAKPPRGKRTKTTFVPESSWIRARRGGLWQLLVDEGETVKSGEALGVIGDPFGADRITVRAPFDGIVVGKTNNPVVHGGDSLVHLGKLTMSKGEGPTPSRPAS
ncbi:MAG: succinylglutamate desuccinylase/aspartoacylase family protein [Planctomycetes bacterium]|nr:succinylglutamate desuccinylase/aspartoacylase family protein [Planctomycetota bacterium]MCB9904410.1 succinylglutamate desuccinylase/aspartoacylase family protein [Planctomycetota bacterium]